MKASYMDCTRKLKGDRDVSNNYFGQNKAAPTDCPYYKLCSFKMKQSFNSDTVILDK